MMCEWKTNCCDFLRKMKVRGKRITFCDSLRKMKMRAKRKKMYPFVFTNLSVLLSFDDICVLRD